MDGSLKRVARIVVWIVVAICCAVAFANTGHMLACAATILVVAIPPVCYLACRRAAPSLSVSLDSSKTSEDSEATLSVSVENASKIPAFSVQVDVLVENLLTGESTTLEAQCSVAGGESVEVALDLASKYAGRVHCAIQRVRAFDPFRVLAYDVPVDAQTWVTILPAYHDVYLRDVRSAAPLSDTTIFSPYVKGSDLSEVFSLRAYEPGDELRRIHWKLSEKTDQLVVREASLPLDNALLVFWDKSVLSSTGSLDIPECADAMAQVVLALMEELVRAGVMFEMSSNDVSSGRCPRMFVNGEGDIYEAVGHVLSSPVAFAEETGLDGYVRLNGALACSRLIYVGSQIPALAPGQTGDFKTLALVCDGAAASDGDTRIVEISDIPGGKAITFTPQSVREALETLGAM